MGFRFVGGDFFATRFRESTNERVSSSPRPKRRLSTGEAFIAFEPAIDIDRRKNVVGFLTSLNLLIETRDGFDYTSADGEAWLRDAGLRVTPHEHLAGTESMVIGTK